VAWQELSRVDVGRLPGVLGGMDGASAIARNWLRSAVDRILEQAREGRRPIPATELEAFVLDTHHDAQARRLAYEMVREVDPAVADRLLPGMIEDPGLEFRRDAVARLVEQCEALLGAGKKAEALPVLQRALTAARDKDQVDKIIGRVRDLGQKVDRPALLGMLVDWRLIGPFPNPKQQGVNTVYPPEQQIDLAGAFDGKGGKVRWKDYASTVESGIIDINAGLGKHLDAVTYATTEFTSPKERDVEVRLGCFTAFKLWVNGELVLVRGDAYTGMGFDHYVAPVRLRPGKNVILLKLCQDDPPPPLPKDCKFQLRVCDQTGGAILSATRAGKKG
jgi:hypothetical protein